MPGARHLLVHSARSMKANQEMKLNRVQVALASIAIVATAILAQVLTPRELMARTSASLDLQTVIPQKFGTWTFVPSISPVTPPDPEGYVQPDKLSAKLYSQEVARGYSDGRGNIVMLLVAYGPVQNYRLKSHRPEICYTAQGFRVSNLFKSEVSVSGCRGADQIDTTDHRAGNPA